MAIKPIADQPTQRGRPLVRVVRLEERWPKWQSSRSPISQLREGARSCEKHTTDYRPDCRSCSIRRNWSSIQWITPDRVGKWRATPRISKPPRSKANGERPSM